MKVCNECNIEKELTEFDSKKSGKYLSGYCKECRRNKIKAHYRNNVEYYKEKARRNKDKCNISYINYKKSLSCEDCKMSFKDEPYLCDFHHLNPEEKEFNIAEKHDLILSTLLKEIEKCIPLCANCHKRRHHLLSLAKLDKASEYESEDI